MLIIQLIGLAALLLDIISVQLKFRKHILAMQVASGLTWVIHFGLLGATTGAYMNAAGVVRSVSYYIFRGENRLKAVPWLLVILTVAIGATTWQGIVSLLPITAMVLAVVAFWQREEQAIRILLLCAAPLWFFYNLIFHSYAGMASDTIAFISTSIALYRYRHLGFRRAEVTVQASND
jgi:RsiW-degrading membrane proteinase PrsW (M82 family)